MDCKASDSKKLFKVFDASKRKRSRKKREGLDDTNSVATDESNSLAQTKTLSIKSAKASLQDVTTAQGDGRAGDRTPKSNRDGDSSPSVSPSPNEGHRGNHSPRRYRRPRQRDGMSLALKAGLVSTPRSISPPMDGLPTADSFIYTFLEEAIKRDKRKHRHSRRHEEHRSHECDRPRERDREEFHCSSRERRRHHRRRRDEIPSREQEEPPKQALNQAIDQTLLFETFAKLCSTFTEKNAALITPALASEVVRSQSHKSLQCEVVSQRDEYDQRPVRLQSREPSHAQLTRPRVRSQENINDSRARLFSPSRVQEERKDRESRYFYEKQKYSKMNVAASRRDLGEDRYRECPTACPARSCTDAYRREDRRDYRDYNDEHRREPVRDRRSFDEDKRRYVEQKTSRSFDVRRDSYVEDERLRRTSRSDSHKKRYDELRDPRDRRYDENNHRRIDERSKYYEDKDRDRERRYSNFPSKDRRSRRNLERFERASVVSRDDEFRERDRYSERERDSGLSVADGECSTVSGKSNYMRVVKQEIAEQREAMDKMMKLWKELMRCFKGMSQNQNQAQEKVIQDSAANVQESAAAQLRLWRECMRRYETVARDVGDTDARLMEEINKQRSEMAEMATMWQECLQRYRTMSNDFNSLKRQLETESPVRQPPPPLVAPPIACPETEGVVPQAPYRIPPGFPPMGGYQPPGSPLRSRASAPPAWWWCGEQAPPPRRRSSPGSRNSRSRERRHHHKERNETRYNKEKSTKPTRGDRPEHRHRKR